MAGAGTLPREAARVVIAGLCAGEASPVRGVALGYLPGLPRAGRGLYAPGNGILCLG